jgi:hypothetical protein
MRHSLIVKQACISSTLKLVRDSPEKNKTPELAANSGVSLFSGESLTSLRVLEMHACLTIERMAHQGI